MNKKVDEILKSGKVKINEDTLKSMKEEEIDSLHALIAVNEEEDEDEKVKKEKEEAVAKAQEEADAKAKADAEADAKEDADDDAPAAFDMSAVKSAVTEAVEGIFEPMGGIAGLTESLVGIKANADKEKADLVEALIANKKCVLEKTQLESLDIKTLVAMARSFIDPNYGLQAGPKIKAHSEELVPRGMAKLIEEKKED